MMIDMSYQKGGVKEFPSWVPPFLPKHVEDLCECITGYFRGLEKATVDLHDLFADEQREMQRALLFLDEYYLSDTPM